MKKIKIGNKFKSLYYTGLSVIVSIIFIIFIVLSTISGVIIKSINNNQTVEQIKDTKSVNEPIKKIIVYDTVKVEIYDTVRVIPKKVKPISVKSEIPDSL